jgi:DNA-binding transcriptional LysR family regulator
MDVLNAMKTYAAVVSTGSFTAAAERLGVSKALTSKYVGQLEDHLGVRLLNRTTRQLNMTEAGQAYYQRCRQLLDEIDELEAAVRDQQEAPKGRLMVAAPTTFGEIYLTPAVADYLQEYPGVTIELVLADRYVDIVDEGFDLAVRIGNLADSSLIARRLAPTRILACAAPQYLAKAGMPSHPSELLSHSCILDTNFEVVENWPFQENGQPFMIRVDGRIRVNNAVAVREMLLAGQGIALCPDYVVAKALSEGRLQAILQGFEALDYGIHAVYPHHRHLAAKVRTFVDFLLHRFAGTNWT